MSVSLRHPTEMFQFEQSTPSDTWVLVHNLKDYPIVDVYVMHEGELQKMLPNEVVYTDLDTCTILFTQPYSGYATVA